MSNTHYLKTSPKYFKAAADGSKPFEVRRNNRHFAVGDILVLQEYDVIAEEYTDKTVAVTVTYVLAESSGYTPKGMDILGIKRLTDAETSK